MRQQVLEEFAAAEGVVWAGILSGEGFIHEAVGADSSHLEGAGSLAPAMLDASDALSSASERGATTRVTALATAGTLVCERLAPDWHLLVRLESGANLGLLRIALSGCCERLRELL
ncbi:MAG: hypothetical protein CXX71_04510 [Methanobacteriota archaeon]|nr:MAG: hypothetical protein CXX71_04510 [Euryarchaeota archaeon]